MPLLTQRLRRIASTTPEEASGSIGWRQGTRVSKNLMYNNDLEDLFMEVNHGPTLVDNTCCFSPVSIVTHITGRCNCT